MKVLSLKDFTRGWIVGKFEPNLYTKDYELGFKYYQKGECEKFHTHLLSDEVTIVLLGEIQMNYQVYREGDIIIQEKGEFTDFICLSDKAITEVYRPDGSFPNDKIIIKSDYE